MKVRDNNAVLYVILYVTQPMTSFDPDLILELVDNLQIGSEARINLFKMAFQFNMMKMLCRVADAATEFCSFCQLLTGCTSVNIKISSVNVS